MWLCVCVQMNGHGVFHFKSGNEYEGNFENDNIHGKGVYNFRNKDQYEGTACDLACVELS